MEIDYRRLLQDVTNTLSDPLTTANETTFELRSMIRNWGGLEYKHLELINHTKKSLWKMRRLLTSVQDCLRYSEMKTLPREDKLLINQFCRELAAEEDFPVQIETDLPDHYAEKLNEEALRTLLKLLLAQSQMRTFRRVETPELDWMILNVTDQMRLGMLTFCITDFGTPVSRIEAEQAFSLPDDENGLFTIDRLDLYNCLLIVKLYHGSIYIDSDYRDGRRVVIHIALRE